MLFIYTFHFVCLALNHFKKDTIAKTEELKFLTKKVNYFGIAGVINYFLIELDTELHLVLRWNILRCVFMVHFNPYIFTSHIIV